MAELDLVVFGELEGPKAAVGATGGVAAGEESEERHPRHLSWCVSQHRRQGAVDEHRAGLGIDIPNTLLREVHQASIAVFLLGGVPHGPVQPPHGAGDGLAHEDADGDGDGDRHHRAPGPVVQGDARQHIGHRGDRGKEKARLRGEGEPHPGEGEDEVRGVAEGAHPAEAVGESDERKADGCEDEGRRPRPSMPGQDQGDQSEGDGGQPDEIQNRDVELVRAGQVVVGDREQAGHHQQLSGPPGSCGRRDGNDTHGRGPSSAWRSSKTVDIIAY